MLRGELRLDDRVSKYVTELHGGYISRHHWPVRAPHVRPALPTDHSPRPNVSCSLAEFINMLNAWMPHAAEEPGQQRNYSRAS
jgi:beta-lactamase class C